MRWYVTLRWIAYQERGSFGKLPANQLKKSVLFSLSWGVYCSGQLLVLLLQKTHNAHTKKRIEQENKIRCSRVVAFYYFLISQRNFRLDLKKVAKWTETSFITLFNYTFFIYHMVKKFCFHNRNIRRSLNHGCYFWKSNVSCFALKTWSVLFRRTGFLLEQHHIQHLSQISPWNGVAQMPSNFDLPPFRFWYPVYIACILSLEPWPCHCRDLTQKSTLNWS